MCRPRSGSSLRPQIGAVKVWLQPAEDKVCLKPKGGIMPWLYKYSNEFLGETIRVWQPLSKEPLTYADAEEIAENVVGYFKVLLKIAERLRFGGGGG